MSYRLPNDAPKCGRCAWWEGTRTIDGANNLLIDSNMGRCANPKATPGMSRCETQFIWGRPAFETWNRLR